MLEGILAGLGEEEGERRDPHEGAIGHAIFVSVVYYFEERG